MQPSHASLYISSYHQGYAWSDGSDRQPDNRCRPNRIATPDGGCSISFDDFGAGLSSFGYLKRLPIDSLKIDGQFVRGVVDSEFDLAMVQSMVEIGKVLNIKTVGELVENHAVAKNSRK